VILAAGGEAGGFVLHLNDGRPVYEYVGPLERRILACAKPLAPGRHTVTFEFSKTGDFRGVAKLTADDMEPVTAELADMWPSPVSGGVTCGFDDGCPVSAAYTMPGTFTGRIYGVTVRTGSDYRIDPALETHIALCED
jgi:hypothetical protein